MIALNNRWRVIEAEDGPPHWLLQRLHANGWQSMSWCQTRAALGAAINEKIVKAHRFYQGGKSMAVDRSALDAIARLPTHAREAIQGSGGREVPARRETLSAKP